MPQPKKPNLQSDAVVDALMADPTQGPPGTTVLTGFLGKSPNEGMWRLYLDPGLTEYVEVPEADIKHSETLPDASGTSIWVLNTTPLTHVRTQTQDVQAEFLGGAITDELLAAQPGPAPAGGPLGPRGPVPIPPTVTGGCLSRLRCPTVVNCPSVGIVCPTARAVCVSRVECPSIQCPSRVTLCGSTRAWCPQPSVVTLCASAQFRCPSLVDACPTRFGCPSVDALCQSIGIGCVPSRLVACPTDPSGCPQPSAAFACPTLGPCPSIAGCPTEGFCDPGGGFDPGQQFGGGGIG